MNFDSKNRCKNEFKDNNEKIAADPEIGFLTKSISKANGYATAMLPAWELICQGLKENYEFLYIIIINYFHVDLDIDQKYQLD